MLTFPLFFSPESHEENIKCEIEEVEFGLVPPDNALNLLCGKMES